jgi:gamma-glutamyltranspeptidase/glutathione hydrolase
MTKEFSMRLMLLILLTLGLVIGGCAPNGNGSAAEASRSATTAPPTQVGPTISVDRGVVVSVCPIASRAGCEVLRRGGNAVDAAIATAFTLAVTWPEAGNIGGGGFMLIHRPVHLHSADHKESAAPPDTFIDYRETAPAAVKADTFANKPSSYLLAGTPGTVKGMRLAYDREGSRQIGWKDLVLPAAQLAADGFAVDAALARSLNSGLKNAEQFAEFRRVYGKPDGSAWAAGDRLVLPELAKTLRAIAEQGADGFYRGDVAKLIADEMARGGGMITLNDLDQYAPQVRTPLRGTFKGHTIVTAPPPSSGGIALLQMLNMLETFDLKPAERWSPRTVHLLVEAARRAYADRARYAGDPGFTEVPVAKLIDPTSAKQMAGTIDPARASRSEDVATWAQVSETGGQTTHFSVVDGDGMAVANTYTLEQSFGGKIVVPGAGFLLNNELGDFNPRPGITTRTGLIGTKPNQAAAGKRPLSSMTPTIVTRDEKPVLVTGSPGGRTIINTVTQVVLNRLAFDMNLRDAVDAPRLHHQWFPDVLHVETSFQKQHADTLTGLAAMRHQVDQKSTSRQGDAHSIEVEPKTGKKTGVADRRIGGAAAGY